MTGQAGVGAAAGRLTVARALAVDRVTGEVVAAFRDAGVQSILLKGPVLAAWLYDDGAARGYVDSDLLVSPPDLEVANSTLERLGFERRPLDAPHAITWARPGAWGQQVDLHTSLPGLCLAPMDAWRQIGLHTAMMKVGECEAQVPRVELRALIVALHAAHHGPDARQPLTDLERAIERASEETWREARVLADRLAATAPFAVGLRLLPQGAVLAGRLGLPSAQLVESVTAPGSRAPLSLGIERLVEHRGPAAKLKLLADELFPTRDFMRWWSALARRGPMGLAMAYPVRWLWLLRHAPASVRAWLRQR